MASMKESNIFHAIRACMVNGTSLITDYKIASRRIHDNAAN